MDDTMTTAEAAAELGLETSHVRRLCERGTLAATKRGRDWFVDRAAVENYRSAERKPGPKPKPRPATK